MIELIIVGVIVVVAVVLIVMYNGLVVARNRVDNAWSQIDVQLKKRSNIIPNLVETVKGYAKHEKQVFENVTKARAQMLSAGNDVKAAERADNMLTGALKTLFAVAESYPQLRANENFLQLQEEISGIENKIAFARQFYNDSVLRYNNGIQTFPSSLVAGLFGFVEKDYFKAASGEKGVPKVSF